MKEERRADNRDKTGPDRAISQSVTRALAVLDLLADAGEDIGVREVARRLSIAPSIAQRLLATLEAGGYVEDASDGMRYRIGYRAFQVGRMFLAKNDLRGSSLPELREMAERDQINAYLGVMRDGAMVYLEALQSTGPIAITSAPGSRGALHSTAFGKALLAELTDDEVRRMLGPEPYRALTAKTRTTFGSLQKELSEARRLGYAVSDQENLDAIYAVGAVIRDASGQAVAGISGAVPHSQLQSKDREKLRDIVTTAAERISRRLGAAPAHLRRTREYSDKQKDPC